MIRPERVQAAFEVWEGKPELGPSATAMFEYIIRLEAEIARLRELLEPFANAVTIHGKRISAELAILKPDTGETP